MQTSSFTPSKLTLAVLLFASMLTLLGGAAVAPALPLISDAFAADETIVSLIVTLPALTVAISGFFIGAIADKIGKVKVLVISLLLFAVAGCSAVFLNSLEMILVGRVIVGLGIAGITSTTTALITSYYTGATRTKILGYQTAAMGFGILVLEIGGGVLASVSWRTAFLIYLLGAVALLGTVLSMKEPPKYVPEVQEKKKKEKLPVGKIAFIYAAVLLGFMFFYLIPTKYPYHLQSIGVTSVIVSGILLGIVGFVGSCVGVFYWRIAGRLPRLVLAAASSIFLGVGFIVVGLTDTISLQLVGLICMGLGNGLLLPTMISWLSSLVPPHSMGAVSGGYGAAINVGSFISSLVAVPILAVVVSYGNMFATFGCIAIAIGVVYLIANVASKKFGA